LTSSLFVAPFGAENEIAQSAHKRKPNLYIVPPWHDKLKKRMDI
jgi:hypothetical protein